MLTQVAGRAGRSPLGGQVILQTFQPDHYVHPGGRRARLRGLLPPGAGLPARAGLPALLPAGPAGIPAPAGGAGAAHRAGAGRAAARLAEGGRPARHPAGRPVPCFFSRIHGLYRWQIVLRGPDPASLLRGRSLGEWRVEVDPPNLL